MDELRRRWRAGEPVTLAEAFDAAGLSGRQRAVVWGRLEGLSFGRLARAVGARSRQRVQQLERQAMRRLGVAATSIAAAVHAAEQEHQAGVPRERSRRTTPADI